MLLGASIGPLVALLKARSPFLAESVDTPRAGIRIPMDWGMLSVNSVLAGMLSVTLTLRQCEEGMLQL